MFSNIKKELNDFGYTINYLIYIYFGFIFIFLVWGVISLDQIFKGNSLEQFKLGNVPIPNFLGADVSNLEVFIFCVLASFAIFIAIIRRYLYIREDIDFLRKNNLKPSDLKIAQKGSINDAFQDDD